MQWCIEQTPPQSRNLTTLDRIKSAAGQETSPTGDPIGGVALPSDDEVNRLIVAASSEIEKEIDRVHKLLYTSYSEFTEGPGNKTIMLSVTPVESIDAVYFKGQQITDVDWIVNPVTGIVYRKSGWDFTGDLWQDGVTIVRLPNPGSPDYQIDYTAGYTSPDWDENNFTLPADLEQFCIRSVLQWTQTQTRDMTLQRTRIGDVTQTYFAGMSNIGGALALPSDVKDGLLAYVRHD